MNLKTEELCPMNRDSPNVRLEEMFDFRQTTRTGFL